MEETIRPIICSTMLRNVVLLVNVVIWCPRRVGILEFSQDHDNDCLIGFLSFRGLVAQAGETG